METLDKWNSGIHFGMPPIGTMLTNVGYPMHLFLWTPVKRNLTETTIYLIAIWNRILTNTSNDAAINCEENPIHLAVVGKLMQIKYAEVAGVFSSRRIH